MQNEKEKASQDFCCFVLVSAVPLIILMGVEEKNFFRWVQGYCISVFQRVEESEFVLSGGW